MKTTSSQKIKIGVFVIAGVVILVLGIFLIGSQKSLFNSTFSVHGIFKNVSGLQVGNNVRFAGINVGVVQNIEIVTDSSVKVTLTLNESVRKFVKKDAKMSIGSDGLMGDKLVVVAPGGTTSTDIVKDGDQLAAVNPLDIDKIINKLTRIGDSGGKLVENLADIVEKINKGHGSIGRLLNNDRMARDLEGTVKQARTTIKQASSTITTVHKTAGTLNEDLKAAQSNFLLRGFFKKKEKAKRDSLKKIEEAKKKAAEAQKKAGNE